MCRSTSTCCEDTIGCVAPARDSPPRGDRRVRRTQTALECALIELIEQQDLSQITVADVAQRADVNRSTFYAHYRDVHELAEAACTAMIDNLLESLSVPDPAQKAQNPSPWLQGFFVNLANHAGLYRRLLGPGGSARVIDHILRRTTTAFYLRACSATTDHAPSARTSSSTDIRHHVPAVFAAGGVIGVATDWLQRGCPQTPTEMATLTRPLLAQCFPGLTPSGTG